MPELETWEEAEAKLAVAREKHAGLRAKIEAALNREPVPEDVYDHSGQQIDYLLLRATDTTCLIKRPHGMLEGAGIPAFHYYTDWKRRVQILLAPDEDKRIAYLTLFEDAEAID